MEHSTGASRPGGSVVTATFSILGYDAASGHLGSAVASRYLAVGSVVPFLQAGVGAINTQHWSKPELALRGLSLLAAGSAPEAVLDALLSNDERPASRQLLIMDAAGRAAVYTGEACTAPCKAALGEGCAAAGNTLASEAVVDAMIAAYANSAGEPLAGRLLNALQAAEDAGGDYRGKQAAAIRLVPPAAAPWGHGCVDLRVDDHPDPIGELSRLYQLAVGK